MHDDGSGAVSVRVVLDAAAVRAAEVGGGDARGPGAARRPDRRRLDGHAVAAHAARWRGAHGRQAVRPAGAGRGRSSRELNGAHGPLRGVRGVA